MYDAFTSRPLNAEPVDAIPARVDLLQRNTPAAPWAALSSRLPLEELDGVSQAQLDAILWKSVYGANSTPPPRGPTRALRIGSSRSGPICRRLTAAGRSVDRAYTQRVMHRQSLTVVAVCLGVLALVGLSGCSSSNNWIQRQLEQRRHDGRRVNSGPARHRFGWQHDGRLRLEQLRVGWRASSSPAWARTVRPSPTPLRASLRVPS